LRARETRRDETRLVGGGAQPQRTRHHLFLRRREAVEGRDDAVADGIQGEHPERLLDEHADFLDVEERGGGGERDGDGEPVAVLPQREGQREVPQHEEAGGDACVGDGDGRFEEALAGADVVVELGDVVVHVDLVPPADMAVRHELRHDLHHVVGFVRRCHHRLQLPRLEYAGELLPQCHILIRALPGLAGGRLFLFNK
jgi:hypothetical protein